MASWIQYLALLVVIQSLVASALLFGRRDNDDDDSRWEKYKKYLSSRKSDKCGDKCSDSQCCVSSSSRKSKLSFWSLFKSRYTCVDKAGEGESCSSKSACGGECAPGLYCDRKRRCKTTSPQKLRPIPTTKPTKEAPTTTTMPTSTTTPSTTTAPTTTTTTTAPTTTTTTTTAAPTTTPTTTTTTTAAPTTTPTTTTTTTTAAPTTTPTTTTTTTTAAPTTPTTTATTTVTLPAAPTTTPTTTTTAAPTTTSTTTTTEAPTTSTTATPVKTRAPPSAKAAPKLVNAWNYGQCKKQCGKDYCCAKLVYVPPKKTGSATRDRIRKFFHALFSDDHACAVPNQEGAPCDAIQSGFQESCGCARGLECGNSGVCIKPQPAVDATAVNATKPSITTTESETTSKSVTTTVAAITTTIKAPTTTEQPTTTFVPTSTTMSACPEKKALIEFCIGMRDAIEKLTIPNVERLFQKYCDESGLVPTLWV